MSVIIEDDEGSLILYCKGAETAVIPQVSDGPVEETLEHVKKFALVSCKSHHFYFVISRSDFAFRMD